MTQFMRMREGIRKFVRAHEILIGRVGHAVLLLVCLSVVATAFPFAAGINKTWIIVPLSVLGAFMPLSALGLVVQAFLLVNLFSLSNSLAGVTLLLLIFAYLFCAVYQARKMHHISGMIVMRELGFTYVIPVQAGLLGTASEVVTVLCGAVMSFYLHEVHSNATLIGNGEGQMTVVNFLRDKVAMNQFFYVYIIANVVLFLIVYAIRTRNIEHAWIMAVVAGVAAEFLIMLGACLFLNQRTGIPALMVANAGAMVIGLMTSYLYQDLDYSRIEKVQFEDDEYYYYVTAVPKIRLTDEKKEVKRITEGSPARGRSQEGE